MKALLISESEDVLNSYAAFFNKAGYDIICYRWLLKAMDNLEEIAPQLVFIDGSDYPRHWKTLVQHIKTGFGPLQPRIFLGAHLSEEESEKADFLGVHCLDTSIEEKDIQEQITALLFSDAAGKTQTHTQVQLKPDNPAERENQNEQYADELEIIDFAEPIESSPNVSKECITLIELENNEDIAPEYIEELPEIGTNTKEFESITEPEIEIPAQPIEIESEADASETVFVKDDFNADFTADSKPEQPAKANTFTFVHPSTKTAVQGSIVEYNPPLLFFRPDDKNLFRSLRFGQKSSGIIKRGDEILNVSVQVQGLDDGVAEMCILKK
ncbi:hypothetical protein H0R92_00340 [Treponema sp. OMZ 840]|uniref:hypothetical protein n=1 Tax=Treponema sp. OMZ 840 TaxID=244313 RepID=UPI003D8B5C27